MDKKVGSSTQPIHVTKTFLPPLSEFVAHLETIWQSGILTNSGPLSVQLETRLKDFLGVPQVYLVSNGTIALQMALKALEVTGEVITTPFSFVATSSSIKWEGLEPKFADICPLTLNIDPKCIEKQITPRTTAIMATHVYGNPCAVDEIQEIADRHGLAVIYDAAHCFGARYRNRSLASFGDLSTLSFHATKIFHTAEGGAITVNTGKVKRDIHFLRNFGIDGQERFNGVGINGKTSELNAALGLTVWPYLAEILQRRKEHVRIYDNLLKSDERLRFPLVPQHFESNGAYYPVIFQSENALKTVLNDLRAMNIFPRRYFYPCLDQLDYVKSDPTPVASDISKRVLCLPLAHEMTEETYRTIALSVLKSLGTSRQSAEPWACS